jgi:pyruvate/2-oxoglutarate dehydrogenase complex dihydrolipoamide dehydrogenase (E3) component
MKFDAIVMGAGQAGDPLAQKLADHGWHVAFIEKEHLGGTCINNGCTPTKTLVASAQIAHYAREAARWGIHTGAVTVDMPAVVARKNKVVEDARHGLEKGTANRKTLHLFRGQARFTGPHTVAVGNDELTAEKIFINTGCRPRIPQIDGLDTVNYLTNISLLEQTTVPEHLLILGGSYVGLEFGQIFARLGSRVTVIHQAAQIMPREDAEIANELQKILQAEGLNFLLQAKTTKVARSGTGVSLTIETPQGTQTVTGSHLLLAVGRIPNTDDLGLDKAGIKTDRGGFIRVNNGLETNVPGVWALGDVKGGPAFTHISFNDYQIVWANVIEGKNQTTDNRYVPYAVFTDPQLGRVGLTEKAAREQGYKLKIGTLPMTSVLRAIERGETAGLMKLVVDASNDKILGASILAADGGETVQMLGVAIWADAPYTLMKGAVYIHPTMAEGLWSLMENVKAVE